MTSTTNGILSHTTARPRMFDRASAKEAVASAWSARAASQPITIRKTAIPSIPEEGKKKKVDGNSYTDGKNVCQLWREVVNFSAETPKEKKKKQEQQKRQGESSQESRRRLSESLSRVGHAAAVAAELANLSTSNRNNDKNQTDSNTVVSILPVGYNQTLQALTYTCSNRTRAFLLLDLASVISSHKTFHTLTHGRGAYFLPRRRMKNKNHKNSGGVTILPQFRVGANRDFELMKLLIRLGVGLRCNDKEDVRVVEEALRVERKALGNVDRGDDDDIDLASCIMMDDGGRTRKPDSYYRRLMLGSGGFSDKGTGMKQNRPRLVSVSVDGPDEVYRVANMVQRLHNRNKQEIDEQDLIVPQCSFLLRLPKFSQSDPDSNNWIELVRSVHEASTRVDGLLAGISIDLSCWCPSPLPQQCTEEDPDHILQVICNKICQIRLAHSTTCHSNNADVTKSIPPLRVDFTGLPYPLNQERVSSLTEKLGSVVNSRLKKDELTKTHSSASTVKGEDTVDSNCVGDPNNDIIFTVDVSEHLVAHAGALCTRIIGVKKVDPSSSKENSSSSSTAVATHYYIDDGCYGSLCTDGINKDEKVCCAEGGRKWNGFHPIPLYGDKTEPSNNDKSSSSKHAQDSPSNQTDQQKQSVNTTVWGPTCDGLDRVCESVPLPPDLKANRDWLVFPQLGCGGGFGSGANGGGLGLGTAFNGFDPPDVAYCVLGYFSGGRMDGF